MSSQTSHRPRLNRIGLIFLSLWVAVLIGSTLYGSWTEPQAQGQISLYQTDLTLEALQWEPPIDESESLTAQLFGESPTADALKQYQKVSSHESSWVRMLVAKYLSSLLKAVGTFGAVIMKYYCVTSNSDSNRMQDRIDLNFHISIMYSASCILHTILTLLTFYDKETGNGKGVFQI